jgi:hypothetical protein
VPEPLLQDRLLAALAQAQREGNPLPGGDPARWRRIILTASGRWRSYRRRHPRRSTDTLEARTEDLNRGLTTQLSRSGRHGPAPDPGQVADLAQRLAAVLNSDRTTATASRSGPQ